MYFCLLLESWLEIWQSLKMISNLISKFDGFFLNKSLNLWQKNQKIHNGVKFGSNKSRCQEPSSTQFKYDQNSVRGSSLTPLVRTHFSTEVS